jgi:hypothetical protein
MLRDIVCVSAAKNRLGGALSYNISLSSLPKVEADLTAEGYTVEIH